MPKTQTSESSMTSKNWNRSTEQLPIQKIDQPGCYVDNRHGFLYRVTPEMLNIGGTVFLGFTSNQPWFVTRIADDPNLALDECRIIAANFSLNVNF